MVLEIHVTHDVVVGICLGSAHLGLIDCRLLNRVAGLVFEALELIFEVHHIKSLFVPESSILKK